MSLDEVQRVRQEAAQAIAQRRASNLAANSGGGAMQVFQSPALRLTMLAGGAVMVGLFLPKLFASKPTTIPQDTPQQSQAMQMMQQMMDSNLQQTKANQELISQMIQSQAKQKTMQPNVYCFFTKVCPGDTQPNQSYAVVGEGVRTAVVDPSKVMPQLQQVQPAQPTQATQPQLPVQSVVYDPKVEQQMQIIRSWDRQTISQYAAFCQMSNNGAGITEYDQLTCRALEVMKQ